MASLKRSLDKRHGLLCDLETPSCILEEIARSLRINADIKRMASEETYRAKVLATISSSKVPVVQAPYSDTDLSYIALFLNPDNSVDWDEESLLQAFDWVWSVRDNLALLEGYDQGYPTPTKIKSASPVYVYRYLLSLGVRTRYDTSFTEMVSVLQAQNYRSDYLYLNVCTLLAVAEKTTLMMLYAQLSKENLQSKPLEPALLSNAFKSLDNKAYRFQPRTNEEAVAAAALHFRKDISTFRVPLLAYCELANGCFTTDAYARKLLQIEKNIYDLSERFNPNFPVYVYTEGELKDMCTRLGLMRSEKMNRNYNQLLSHYMVDNFHLGPVPGVSLETPIQMQELADYPKESIVTYGSYGSSFVAYTVEELKYTFESNDYFCDPLGGIYSKEAIKTLDTFANRLKRDKHWEELKKIIYVLKKKSNDLNFQKQCFLDHYLTLSEKDQARTRELLLDLLNFGLVSRGWQEGQPWPIRHVPEYDTEEVAMHARDVLDRLRKKVNLNNPVDKAVMQLPLLRVMPKTHAIDFNRDVEHGFTVWQKLEMNWYSKKSMSCIRTSSSFTLATAYTFLNTVGVVVNQEEEFQRMKIVL